MGLIGISRAKHNLPNIIKCANASATYSVSLHVYCTLHWSGLRLSRMNHNW